MMVVYSSLLMLVLIVGLPYWLIRMATSGRYRAGLTGRLGKLPHGLREAVGGHNVIWVHAVSVGEVLAAVQLIGELQRTLPGWVIAVSTTTETGQRLAKKRLPGMPVFYLPLDLAFSVRRYLGVLQPRLLVLMESELWPRLLVECKRYGVPVAIANARISDRSFPRYMRLRRLWRPLLGKISLLLAQSEETADRLRKIGAPADHIRVVGNLKFDVRVSGANEMTEMLRIRLVPGTKVVVCGSTLDGEERALLEAWSEVLKTEPNTVMILAPRHPDRFRVVTEVLTASPFKWVRATELDGPVAGGKVVLLDTIGDLAAVYSLGSAAFVGGSLIPAGGHNPLEPAQFGVPVLMGPSFENFREVVEVMQANDAVRIVVPGGLGAALVNLLSNEEDARSLGARGRRVFEAEAGATARTVEALRGLVRESAGGR